MPDAMATPQDTIKDIFGSRRPQVKLKDLKKMARFRPSEHLFSPLPPLQGHGNKSFARLVTEYIRM